MVDDDEYDDDDDHTLVDDVLETVAATSASVVGDDDDGSLAPWPGTCTYRDKWTDKYSFIGRVKGRISFL